jgi:hypothetical protein
MSSSFSVEVDLCYLCMAAKKSRILEIGGHRTKTRIDFPEHYYYYVELLGVPGILGGLWYMSERWMGSRVDNCHRRLGVLIPVACIAG